MMTRRLPHENFIRYLIARGKDDSHIREKLVEFGLMEPDDRYLEELREEMEPFPKGYNPEKLSNKVTKKYADKFDVREIWEGKPYTYESLVILGQPRVKSDVDRSILGNVSATKICKHVRKELNVELTPSGVLHYRKYYCNKDLLSQDDWLEYIRLSGPSGVIAKQSCILGGRRMAEWGLGLEYNFDPVRAMRDMEAASYFKFMEMASPYTPNNFENARTAGIWNKCFIETSRLETEQGSQVNKFAEALKKFRIKRQERELSGGIEELAGNNFQGSGDGLDKERERRRKDSSLIGKEDKK